MIHELKSRPDEFRAVFKGIKTFEYRKNDRGYSVGDTLLLKEYYSSSGVYTGEELSAYVCYIIYGACAPPEFGIPEDYCIMGIKV